VDSDRSSQLRALALASRCLAREIRRLKDGPNPEDQDDTCRFEIERVVHLARTILDPSYSADRPKPGAPRTPAKSAPAKKKAASDNHLIDLLGDGPPSPEHTLGFLGHGTAIPIPELVGFLGSLGVGGILKVSTKKELFFVEFAQGHVVHAEATRAPLGQRLGDLLVAQNAIDRIVLEEVAAEGIAWKLGRRLLDEGHVTRDQLVRALRTQIQLLFCRLFREVARSFTFWTGPPLCGEIGVRLNSTSLLLEGARASDEAKGASDKSGVPPSNGYGWKEQR
jgi:hypothetical protein